MNRRAFTRVGGLLAAALLALGLPARSLPAQGLTSRWTPRLQLDNDAYNFWKWHTKRPDEEYTNGVFASLDGWQAPRWARMFARSVKDCTEAQAGAPCHGAQLTMAQELYTPNLRRVPGTFERWEDERPFFAWLFMRQASVVMTPTTRRVLAAAVGVTGAPAMGSVAQTVAHRFGVTAPPTGWDTQIGFEPGVLLEFRQGWKLPITNPIPGARAIDIAMVPEVAASVGTIRTQWESGLAIRIGSRWTHPWYPLLSQRPAMGWWVTAGGHGALVARDMSLDGTLRSPTRRVDRTTGYVEYAIGGGVQLGPLTVGYRAHTRSREYATGPRQRSYSTMSVAWMPSR